MVFAHRVLKENYMGYSVSTLCKKRRIKALDLSVPLLVPSFSSKGFSDLSSLWGNLKPYLPGAILISCYDLYYEYIDFDEVVDTIFLDSGGYETNLVPDLSSVDQSVYPHKEWNINR